MFGNNDNKVPLKVGDIVHGFAGGFFGRDSYNCREVEEVGPDWALLRDTDGDLSLATSRDIYPKWFFPYLEAGADEHCHCLDWDESYNQEAKCECEHPYHRHFDSYDDMSPVGCKYCECREFKEVE